MIELTSVTKSYGKKTAVRDLSFTVSPGRVTGFLGPNGCRGAAFPNRDGPLRPRPRGPGTLAPWAGFGVFRAYVVIAFAIAAALLVRRDA